LERIIIKDLRLFGYHGCNPEEKQNGQNFVLDIVISADKKWLDMRDNLEDTLNYAHIVKFVTKIFTAEHFNLIETVCCCLCYRTMFHFKNITEITVTVKKPEAPMNADFGYVAAEKTVRRDEENADAAAYRFST